MTDDVAHDRPTARRLGLPLYQGARCKHGHAGIRYTGNKACRDCASNERALARATMTPDEQERERKRKRDAKRSGRWKVQPRDRERENATRRAKAAIERDRPENVLNHQRIEFARLAVRLAAASHSAILRGERRQHLESDAHKADVKARADANNRLKAKRRRAVTRGAASSVTEREVRDIGESQGWRCAYCGSSDKMHLDHKQAVSRGGGHNAFNLQWLCGVHNMNKKTRHDLAYRRTNDIPLITPWDGPIHRLLMFAIFAA